VIYKIDQSGKVEDIGRDTVLAICNGKSFTVKISSKTKIGIRKMFGKSGRGNIYVYRVFSILIFLLIRSCGFVVNEVIIDEEYTGQEKTLINMLSQLFTQNRSKRPEIYFARIGNKPTVHYAAYNVYKRKKKADMVINLKQILNLTTKKDRGLK